jgi:hypothetical protein
MTVIIDGTTGITSVNGSAAAPSVTGTDTDTGIVYGTNTLSLATGGVAGLTQDSSQNVIIGASATDSGAKTRVVFGASQNGLQIKDSNDTSNAAYLIFQNGSNSNFATIQRDGTNNSLSIGTVSAITFPATQVASAGANTLDDYEEGQWTPTIIGSSTNPTITYGQRSGQYTKIGRVCYFVCTVTMSAYSGGSGRVLVTGLPFAAAANGTGNGAPANTLVSYMNLSAGYSYITNYVDPATTNFNWLEIGDNVSYNDMLVGSFQASTTFIVSGFYIVG